MTANVRTLAARVLAEVIKGERSLAALPSTPNLTAQDRALLQELCFGVCRYFFELQSIVRQLLPKPLKSKDSDVLALLYLGLYQLRHTRIPDHAAIGATVESAVGLKKPWAKGLINGVLRNAQRKLDSLTPTDTEGQFNHPLWLIELLQKSWADQWQTILVNNDQRPPFTLRVNKRHNTRDEYLVALKEAGIDATACAFAADGITLSEARPVQDLPGFQQARVSVQDEAAQLAPDVLQLAPGQRVLDACAAPGGKTCHIIEREAGLEEVIALDVDAERLARVRDNLQRLGLNATLKAADAAQLDSWWDGRPFDRILLDAPCSATGVIRRHPDIKLLRRPDDIAKLAALQRKLLGELWRTLKPGGILVYATCSVLPQENEHNIAAFLADHSDAEHLAIEAEWGITRPFGRQLLPQHGGHDGFYYAALRKTQAP